jgi:hypothetical protein
MSGRRRGMGIEEFVRDGRTFDVSGRDSHRRGA